MQDQMIRVLGPIDVLGPDGPTSVGGHQARVVIGALAIGAGRAVSIDHLMALLWGEHPPPSAHNTLQSYISQLRHLLGADVVINVDHSYELHVDADQLDALRFAQLVDEASASREDPERCRQICGEALGLWRGRPFGDLADDDGFRLESYRLDELRLVTMELSLEADLRLGRHELVVGELESAVEEHPYREHLWHLLVVALAGSERRVEALRACSRLRCALAEIGLAPTDQLVTLERDILAGQTPSLFD